MIYKSTETDIPKIADMAVLLWEGYSIEELAAGFAEIIRCDEGAIFLSVNENTAVGFAQVQLRHDYVEGTNSSPVGYLEAIFVKSEYRKCGYGKELLKRCEEWAMEKGCTEFASDCELTNSMSLAFHLNAGFTEANRIICFTKNYQTALIDKIFYSEMYKNFSHSAIEKKTYIWYNSLSTVFKGAYRWQKLKSQFCLEDSQKTTLCHFNRLTR